jgi:hypothetical protein
MSRERNSALSATPAPEVATEPGAWRPPRWVVPLFGLAALVLVPWVVLLVVALPSAHRAAHWDVAWAGFDVALALILLTVAVAAWRRSPWLEGAASAAATLLFVLQRRIILAVSPACKPAHPLFLLNGLDSFGLVGVSHPSNGFRRRSARKNGHARQHRPGAAIATETADLDKFAAARSHERVLDLPRGGLSVVG